jgi:RNA polymerase sigma factor (sigma-70 family)
MADRFPTTRLSLVLAASVREGTDARDALADLCRLYWHPLYAYVRRQGYDADQAQDLTQSFIARLLEKDALSRFRQDRGRFRSFLLASLKHFLSNERDAARSQKRGGGAAEVPLDRAPEPREEETPDKLFERQWALGLIARVMEQVRVECVRTGKAEQFERLKGCVAGDTDHASYQALGGELGMSESAVKVAVFRLRQRFHEALRREISMTVTDEAEIGDEIRYLLGVLGA